MSTSQLNKAAFCHQRPSGMVPILRRGCQGNVTLNKLRGKPPPPPPPLRPRITPFPRNEHENQVGMQFPQNCTDRSCAAVSTSQETFLISYMVSILCHASQPCPERALGSGSGFQDILEACLFKQMCLKSASGREGTLRISPAVTPSPGKAKFLGGVDTYTCM